MKIAQLVCVFPPYKGGIGNSAYYFAKLLAEKNSVDVYTPYYSANINSRKKNKFNLKLLKTPLKFGKGAFLAQIFFKLRKYDLVYLHYPFFGTAELVYLAKIIFKNDFKLVIHYHMDTLSLSWPMKILSWPMKIIEKDLFRRADVITYASIDYIKNSQIKSIYYQYPKKFHEISFGVDENVLKEENFNKNNNDIKNILFVGGLDKAHYFKGLKVLFNALRNIKINFLLKIVGTGDLINYYKDLVKKYNLERKVEFKEDVDNNELFKLYREADLFILASINNHEAFGIVLIEAMSQFTPVIASNLPGVRSVFNDGEEGFLVKVNSYRDLRKKIELIFKDKEKYNQMCLNARRLVLEKYNWNKIGEKLNNLFNKIYNEDLLS